MKRFPAVLVALALLSAATQAPAACRRFGTQLECDLGWSQLLIGTQAAARPTSMRPFQPQGLQYGDGLLDDHAVPAWPFRFQLQNIGTDPLLCRKVGNETYCY